MNFECQHVSTTIITIITVAPRVAWRGCFVSFRRQVGEGRTGLQQAAVAVSRTLNSWGDGAALLEDGLLRTAVGSGHPSPRRHPREMEVSVPTKTCTHVFTAAQLAVAKNRKPPKWAKDPRAVHTRAFQERREDTSLRLARP